MHTLRLPLTLFLVMILLFALAPAGRASAAEPVIEFVSIDIDYMLEEQPCPGIQVWNHEVITWRVTTFFDNYGSTKRVRLHITEGIDTFYNPDNPGVSLSGNFGGNGYIDLQTGDTINVSGIIAHITVPGYGRVFMYTGHWLLYPTIHLGGLYSLYDPEDMAEFCALLGAP